MFFGTGSKIHQAMITNLRKIQGGPRKWDEITDISGLINRQMGGITLLIRVITPLVVVSPLLGMSLNKDKKHPGILHGFFLGFGNKWQVAYNHLKGSI